MRKTEKKHVLLTRTAAVLLAALFLAGALGGCGKRKDAAEAAAVPTAAPAESVAVATAAPAEAVPVWTAVPETTPLPAEAPAAVPTAAPVITFERQDGERFEDIIVIEGMEETVRYEYLINEEIGVAMAYDYERFTRTGGPDGERFVSVWDDPGAPENYLEVTFRPEDAETVAEEISEELSAEYEVRRDTFELYHAGTCIRIHADEVKGGGFMPDRLQMVYVIPAADGCRVAVEHYEIVESEGFGKRFSAMMRTLTVLPKPGAAPLANAQAAPAITDEQAVSAIRAYCLAADPTLEGILNAGEYPVLWEAASSDEKEVVVLFRSYTGAESRYYIDRATGDAYVTEYVPGITPVEERTNETLNVRNYL